MLKHILKKFLSEESDLGSKKRYSYGDFLVYTKYGWKKARITVILTDTEKVV